MVITKNNAFEIQVSIGNASDWLKMSLEDLDCILDEKLCKGTGKNSKKAITVCSTLTG